MELIFNLALLFIFVATILFMIAVFRYYNKIPKGAQVLDIVGELKKVANVEENIIDTRKIYIIRNKEQINEEATIMYFHGGGYIGGITRRHLNVIYKLLNDTKMKIILPDYPLAPKATYLNVFEWIEKLYEEYQDEKNMIFMGDSAGAGLALAFSQKLGEENRKQPKKLILISPWLDLTLENELVLEKEKNEKVLKKSILKFAAEAYAANEERSNYLMSPVNGPMDKIYNVSVFTGTADMLNPDARLFKARAEENINVNLKFYEKENAPHNWIFDDLENTKEDYNKVVEEIINFEK